MLTTHFANKFLLFFSYLLFVYCILLTPVKAVNPAPLSCVENNSTTVHNPKTLVIDFNPNINNNGTVTDLRSYMKTIDTRTFPIGTTGTRESGWGDPLDIAEDFKDVIYDVSDQKVNYSIVDILRITQTDGVGLINGTPGITNVEKVGFSQDRFLKCWQLKNNPQNNFTSNLTTNKTTLSKSSPHSGGETKQTLEANKVIEGACKIKSINYSENDFWISHRIRTTVNGVEQILYEYILESDVSTLPSDFPMCNMCDFEVDIVKLAEDKDLCGKINRGEIDEVWFFGPKYGIKADYAGGIENALISPLKDKDLYASHGNFRLDLCDTPMPFTVSNYEGGKYGIANYSLMHYSGHRMEYYLTNYMYQRDVYNRTTGKNTVDWTKYNSNLANFGYLLPTYQGDRFALESSSWLDGALNATTAGCGTTHADPLSTDDYKHAVPGTAKSSCWNPVTNLGYNLTGIRSTVDITNQEIEYSCNLWGCTSEGWQKFWFDKVPSNEGATKELLNDWWTYYLDPEKAKVKYAEKSACTCPSGYMYNSTTQQCEVFSCTNPSNSCAIQNLSGKPVCDTNTGICVECSQNSQCPVSKSWCNANVCTACTGTVVNGTCVSCPVVDITKPYYNNLTYRCEACPVSTIWNGINCVRTGCIDTPSVCTGTTPYCDSNSNTCVSCVTDGNCNLGAHCVNGSCSQCSSSAPESASSSILCSGSLPSIYSPCPQDPADTVNLGGTDFPVYKMPHCRACSSGSTDPYCANSCNLATQDRVFDAQKNLYRCVEKECSPGVICSNNPTAKWCSEGLCKECPAGANFDATSNSCVYCANDEMWDGAKCVEKTCGNGGITCGGDTPVCNTSDTFYAYYNKCVQCNTDSDCASNICDTSSHVCLTCPSGQHYNTNTNTCVTCANFSAFDPTRTYIWDPINNQCVARQLCGSSYCTSASAPYCNTSNNSCMECVSDLDCTDNSDGSYSPDEKFCDMGKCSRCPSSSPNYNVYTQQCVAACTASQVWNGRNCVDSITQSTQFEYLCGADVQSLRRYNNTIPIPLRLGSSDPVCSSVKPYCAGTLRTQAAATFNNYEYSSNRTIPNCVECIGNIDCPSDSPVCLGGRCTPCSPDNPLFDSGTGRCVKCPIGAKYDRASNSCISCPLGQVIDKISGACVTPSCTNGLVQCPSSAPICNAAGNCVVCENSTQCGGATPVCENNLCVNCILYDQQSGLCSPPTGIPGAGVLYWDGVEYVTPTCTNGGVKCEDNGQVCDPESSACVECVSNTQCKDSTKPICDGDTRACIGCPTDKPVFGAVYHYSQNYEGYISSISEPTNEVLTLQSISSSGEDQIFSENFVHVTYECQACPLGSTWDGVKCQAADCRSGNSCSSGLVCNTSNGDCVQCMSSSDCGDSTPICESNSCRRCPSTSPYLDTTDNMCKACPAGLTWFNGKCLSDEQLNLEVYTSYDKDADQLFDPSKDMGISNVGVTLKGVTYDGSNVVQYEETDIDGKVVFSNLIPGNYELEQIQPSSFSDKTIYGVSSENLISENHISNVELFANTSTPIVFMEGGWKVEGKVYVDTNKDGQYSVGEEILANVKVKLVGENLTKETLTDSSGNYYFDNLVNGDYTLTEVQPLGYVTGIENSSNQVSININSSDKVVNFGENELSVTVYTLIDLDNSGTITEGDIPIYNTTVKLTGMDVLGSTVILEKQTGIDGKVVFDSLLEGTYSISEVQPQTVTDGPEVVGNLGGTVGTDAINGIILNANATGYAFLEYGWKVSGKVFVDIDKDNVIDSIDVGVAGVKLTLNNQSITLPYNAKILGVTSFVATTDNAGNYSFDNMPNGNYTLTQEQPSAYLTNNSNSITFVIVNSHSSSNNFSELGGKIGGVVFDDLNGNGIRDTNEQYISNLEVLLLDKNGAKYSTTLTDASGAFIFNALPAGTYTLSIPSIKYSKVIIINPAEEVLGINVGKFTDLPKTGRDWILFKFIKVY